jgi:hypothetical protein
MSLPLLLLLTASPAISAETRVTSEPAGRFAGVERTNFTGLPTIASDFDGTNHVVVWADNRAGAVELFGARVTPAGAVLEPTGRLLVPPELAVEYGECALAFDGTNHLLVFLRTATQAGYVGDELYAQRFDKNLAPVDAAPFRISSSIFAQAPAVSFDGTQFVVAWAAGDMASLTAMNTSRLAARVSTAGQVLDPNGITLDSVPAGFYTFISAASAGGVTLITWDYPANTTTGEQQARFVRLASNGTRLDASPMNLGGLSRYGVRPSVASNGTRFLVTWLYGTYSGATASVHVEAARVGTSGAPVDATPIDLVGGGLEYSEGDPLPDWTGTEWHVVWSKYDTVTSFEGIRLGDDGMKRGSVATLMNKTAELIAVSWSGTDELFAAVTWKSDDSQGPLVEGRRFDATLNALDTGLLAIGQAAPMQMARNTASNGTVALTAWLERKDSWGWELRAGRVDAQGTALDGAGVLVDASPFPGAQVGWDVAATWDGENFLIAWAEQKSGMNVSFIYFARVSAAGVVLDPGGVPITNGDYDVNLASVGNGQSLICWRDTASQCARVKSGALQNTFMVGTNSVARAVASVAGTFVVAWTDVPGGGGLSGTLQYATVDPASGATGGPVALSSSAYWPGKLSFASGPDGAVLIWPMDGGGLNATFFNTSLMQVRTVLLDNDMTAALGAAAENGSWLFEWTHEYYATLGNVWLQRFDTSGMTVDAAPIHVMDATAMNLGGVAAAGAGWVATYSRFDATDGISNQRVFARTVMPCMMAMCGIADAGVPLPDAGEPQPDAGMPGTDAGQPLPDGGSDGGLMEGTPDGGVTGSLSITSQPPLQASCDMTWHYDVQISGDGPIAWSLTKAPDGMAISAVTGSGGTLTWTPGLSDAPSRDVEITASNASGTTHQSFTVQVDCEPSRVKNGCGCGSPGAAWLGLVPLALRAARRRRSAVE